MTHAAEDQSRELEELRALVEEVRLDYEALNAVANYVPSLLCLVDSDGTVRESASNVAFERALGYDASEVGGVLFWERYVPPEDAVDVQEAFEAALAGEPMSERDGRWLTKEGDIVDVLWSCTTLPLVKSGQVMLLCATDITERKRQEDEVRSSRARIVAAADDARRRLERNLHDGAQQRLMSVLLQLRFARSQSAGQDVGAVVDGAIDELAEAVKELRELARGIHPEVLTRRGLDPALCAMAERMPLPVEVTVPSDRFPEAVEAAAYYVVSESLANVVKYAQATRASVRAERVGGALVVEIVDDGVGGADIDAGTGLRGLGDRVAALDGALLVDSPAGEGTRVRAEIPVTAAAG